MSLALLFHYLLLNMFRMLIHSSSGACDLFVISWVVFLWFDLCWCHGVVWLGWCGVVSECRLKHFFNLHPDTTPPQPNHNVTPTRIVPEKYNP